VARRALAGRYVRNICVALLLGSAGVGIVAYSLFKTFVAAPMYTVGQAARVLEHEAPPPQPSPGDRYWRVDPNMTLYHTHYLAAAAPNADDEGGGSQQPLHVLYVHGGPAAPEPELAPGLVALARGIAHELRGRGGGGGVVLHAFDARGSGRSSRLFDSFPDASMASAWARMRALEGGLGLGAQVADIERVRR
jgi:hypothetical protein